jgi:hypothetical protein
VQRSATVRKSPVMVLIMTIAVFREGNRVFRELEP